MTIEERDAQLTEILKFMETAKVMLSTLRDAASYNASLDGRSLSNSITRLEESQLWVANARV